ncbi:hypothetical protein AK812_SmicGene28987 [Symbiodinium microadriaticum]|uniref:Uncharacterized protein n=1 Tax=Symbiodinium microadriaticum TaxID=2951 RepID=A0A1Q9D2Y2_SYMMI|nr:hypothetical protein AK812_SmicGene28987 [Symbiodinium microadriaticum]CAE7222967.1 unnamed protein product [Symbiodinium sp. KB8]CAE7414993.1 unnamed protein product [Symbiodinium microadriaticum]
MPSSDRHNDIDINMPMQVKFVINFGRKRFACNLEMGRFDLQLTTLMSTLSVLEHCSNAAGEESEAAFMQCQIEQLNSIRHAVLKSARKMPIEEEAAPTGTESNGTLVYRPTTEETAALDNNFSQEVSGNEPVRNAKPVPEPKEAHPKKTASKFGNFKLLKAVQDMVKMRGSSKRDGVKKMRATGHSFPLPRQPIRKVDEEVYDSDEEGLDLDSDDDTVCLPHSVVPADTSSKAYAGRNGHELPLSNRSANRGKVTPVVSFTSGF